MSKFMKFIGTSDRRVISADDWKALDIDAHTVVWDRSNGWVVDISDLPPEAQENISAGKFFVEVQESVAMVDLAFARRLQPGSRRTRADRERRELPVTDGGNPGGRGRGRRAEVPE